MRPYVFTFPAADDDGICAAQTVAGAGAIIINGALLDAATFNLQPSVRQVDLPGIQRVVSLTSTGNLSAANITITGTKVSGAAVTETRAGPNNNTVETTAEFHTITSVTTDAAIGTAIKVGTGSTGVTNWLMTNSNVSPFAVTVAVTIVATSSVTVQDTPDDVITNTSPTVYNHPTLSTIAASAESNYAYPARFIRGKMVSSSGSGSFVLTAIQAGI